MWNFAKKLATAGVTTLLAASSSLSAFVGDYVDNSGCYNDCFYQNNNSSFCCGDWSIEAEVLLWRTNVDELPVGRTFHSATNPPITVPLPGDGTITVTNAQCLSYFTKYLDFDWKPGARVTLGYKSPCSCWDLGFVWTWLYSSAGAHLSDDSPLDTSFIESAWTSGATPPFVTTAALPIIEDRIKADWSLQYNTFEFGAGYTFHACCDQFIVRPHVDLKVALIRQRFTNRHEADFTGFPTTQTGVFLPFTLIDQVRLTRDYVGVGPQIGLDLQYNLCGGLGIYAKAAAALLYAEPQIKFRGKYKTDSSVSVLNFDNNDDNRSRTDPRHINFNSQLGAGFIYSKWVCDCSYRLTFKLGWEHNFYTDQNQFHRPAFAVTSANTAGSDIWFPAENGNLSLYGLTASIGLDY